MKSDRLFEKSKHRNSADMAAANQVFAAADPIGDGEVKLSRLKSAIEKLSLQAERRRHGREMQAATNLSQLTELAEVT